MQRIHWQRCMGMKSGAGFDSAYPVAATLPTTAGTDSIYANRGVDVAGIGSPTVVAPSTGGVMFVEVNYQYNPAFGSMFVSPQIIHYSASFIVRDNRDFPHIYPSLGFAASTCDKHNS